MEATAGVVVLLFVAGFTALLGYLVRFRGRTNLVAGFESGQGFLGGFDPEQAVDEAELARFVGNFVLLVALLTGGMAATMATGTDSDLTWAGYTLFVCLGAVFVSIRARGY